MTNTDHTATVERYTETGIGHGASFLVERTRWRLHWTSATGRPLTSTFSTKHEAIECARRLGLTVTSR